MLQEGQPTILEVKGLKKSFGKNEVLKGIDLEIKKGEVLAIIGPSGCGKKVRPDAAKVLL